MQVFSPVQQWTVDYVKIYTKKNDIEPPRPPGKATKQTDGLG